MIADPRDASLDHLRTTQTQKEVQSVAAKATIVCALPLQIGWITVRGGSLVEGKEARKRVRQAQAAVAIVISWLRSSRKTTSIEVGSGSAARPGDRTGTLTPDNTYADASRPAQGQPHLTVAASTRPQRLVTERVGINNAIHGNGR
ncbi:hypothetical protein MBM_07613 [Drepanopeziza brunnea f. sp. 'multigermtubi' MB_m1]|uniref:Uncharacterized protein n=1 Tax=Marssonina brunnea f. sp. multigermtubi (strain MB_m1) TaxID=1072389 RepID=K1X0H7_MARBU|nr:uncharacterized protein MBM_07613 [Drepanopeziza brunnea f. sp. 'multigermtubi' MB_m1]EKD14383.1 hypothetical protein MBM_07613 [Drepanopeziza brunnea f. sp. 'multigermtubi' MB_m1]